LRRQAYLIGQSELIPENGKNIEVPNQGQRAEAFVARAESFLLEYKYKQALQDLQSAIQENSEYIAAYVVMARLFHETGHYGLMREVLHEGVKNTRSRSGLLGLSLYWDTVVGTGSTRSSLETSDQLDSRALYGLGVSSAISGDRKNYDAIESLISGKGIL